MPRTLIGVCVVLLTGMLGAQGAISLDGKSGFGRTVVSTFAVQNTTWEAWVRLPAYVKAATGGPILFRWGQYGLWSPWVVSSNGTAVSGNLHGGQSILSKPGALKIGQWHHVATVFEGQALPTVRFYVDGKLLGTVKGSSAQKYGNANELVMGAIRNRGYSLFLAAELDEVRLSTVQRYTANFVPSRRHVADAATFGLWHFDEGKGTIAKDASKNKRHMTLVGGYKWVKGITYPSLCVSAESLSLSRGGTIFFDMKAPQTEANKLVFLLGSLSGTKPGLTLGAHNLPLNVDGYFTLLVIGHNLVLPGSLQFLDAQAQARAQLTIPGGMLGQLAGSTMHHAYVVLGWKTAPAFRFTSVPTATKLLK